jgi:hypothetical protein
MCAGHSCDQPESNRTGIPFCSLPAGARHDIVAGFREGRSPDLLVVTGARTVVGGTGAGERTPWPAAHASATSVPLAFWGRGVDTDATIPEGTTVDAVAPTIAEIMGVHRPHPEVRSGTELDGVASGDRPRLVVELVLKGVGTDAFNAASWPHLWRSVQQSAHASAVLGSSPADPAATITSIGTGGLPYQHGITGTTLRNDRGQLTQAWGRGAPLSVIATLGDDLDHVTHQEARVGLVGTASSDRGLIGGHWYIRVDGDDVGYAETAQTEATKSMDTLGRGYGSDETPDLLAVTLEGGDPDSDAAAARIVRAARSQAHDSVAFAMVGTGGAVTGDNGSVDADKVRAIVERGVPGTTPVIAATTPGGFFLDQKALAREEISDDEVIRSVESAAIGRQPLFTDVFSSITVSFARYC